MINSFKPLRNAAAAGFALASSALAGSALAGSAQISPDAVPILDQILRAPSHVTGLTDAQVAGIDRQLVDIIIKRQPKRLVIGETSHCNVQGYQFMDAASGLRELLKILLIEENSNEQDSHKAIVLYSRLTDEQKVVLSEKDKKRLSGIVEGMLDDTGVARVKQCAQKLEAKAAYQAGREEAARQIALVVKYDQLQHTVIDGITQDAVAASNAAWAKYQETSDPADYRAFVEIRNEQQKLAGAMVTLSEKRGLNAYFGGAAHVEERTQGKPTTLRENVPDDGVEIGGTLSFVIGISDADFARVKEEALHNLHQYVSADYRISLDPKHFGVFRLQPPGQASLGFKESKLETTDGRQGVIPAAVAVPTQNSTEAALSLR